MEKKGCSKALFILLMITLIAAGGYIVYQYKAYNDLKKDCNKTVTEEKKEESTTNVTEDTSLKEGYITLKIGQTLSDTVNVYGVEKYVEDQGLVAAYGNSLYRIHGEHSFYCLNQIPSATFDAEGKYECNIGSLGYGATTIYKFNGKESDLVKVVYRNSILSSGGAPYATLIYKDGSVESSIKAVESTLKNYKIKDLIGEECVKNGEIACVSASYEVVLQDGTTTKVPMNE